MRRLNEGWLNSDLTKPLNQRDDHVRAGVTGNAIINESKAFCIRFFLGFYVGCVRSVAWVLSLFKKVLERPGTVR